MSVYLKEKYRNGFLKSEEWKDIRIAVLAHVDARCRICGYRSLSNDGHHVFYPKSVWKTKEEDIIILCRECHELIHAILNIKKSTTTPHKRSQSFRELRLFLDHMSHWKAILDTRNSTIRRLKRNKPIITIPKPITVIPELKPLPNVLGPYIIVHGDKDNECLVCRQKSTDVTRRILPINSITVHQWPFCENCWNLFVRETSEIKDLKFKDFRSFLNAHKKPREKKVLTIVDEYVI